MMDIKRVPAIFFQTAQGTEPVREWLLSLNKADRSAIGADIKTVEYGWPVGMPVCRPLGQGLWEVRTRLENRIVRVLFCIHQEHMVLLHGFIKKSRETPGPDKKLALRRKKELEAHE